MIALYASEISRNPRWVRGPYTNITLVKHNSSPRTRNLPTRNHPYHPVSLTFHESDLFRQIEPARYGWRIMGGIVICVPGRQVRYTMGCSCRLSRFVSHRSVRLRLFHWPVQSFRMFSVTMVNVSGWEGINMSIAKHADNTRR